LFAELERTQHEKVALERYQYKISVCVCARVGDLDSCGLLFY